jgi:hypothetical protein
MSGGVVLLRLSAVHPLLPLLVAVPPFCEVLRSALALINRFLLQSPIILLKSGPSMIRSSQVGNHHLNQSLLSSVLSLQDTPEFQKSLDYRTCMISSHEILVTWASLSLLSSSMQH